MHCILYFAPLLLSALNPGVQADGIYDLNKIQAMVTNVTNQLSSTLMAVNNTVTNTNNHKHVTTQTYSIRYASDYSTASNLQAIVDTVGIAKENVADKDSFYEKHDNSSIAQAYQGYINRVPTLAQDLENRGHAWHTEENQPVYLTIGSLVRVIHNYSYALAEIGAIDQLAIIRTITAGSRLTDAQGAWSNTGSLPN